MRQQLINYLRDKWNIVLLCLGILALTDFGMLFFKPVAISEWVTANLRYLFWAELLLLVSIILVLVHKNQNLKAEIDKWRSMDQKTVVEETMFNFYDERGELKLAAKPDAVYYLEAADNYVQIHYLSAGKLQSVMVRNSLKNIEWRFRETSLVRCHRSFIVNLQRVQMLRRQDGDVVLDFGDTKLPVIPVSKIYSTTVMDKFTQK